MTKKEYLNALIAGLISLSTDELIRVKAYYEEMIDDRVEEGMTEEAAVAELEPPESLAKKLLEENGVAAGRNAGVGQGEKDRFRFSGEIRELATRIGSIDVDLRAEALEEGCAARIFLEGVREEDVHASLAEGKLYIEERENPRRILFRFGPRRMQILLNRAELEALDYHTASGDARIVGLKPARAAIQTASGDLRLEELECGGTLEVTAASGDIKLTEVRAAGKASVRSASGDVEVQECAFEEAQISTASGDVSLEETHFSGELNALTASGDISFDAVSAGSIALKTATGDVEGTLRGTEEDYRFVTQSNNGDVHVPATDGPRLVRVKTATGDVRLRVVP